METNNHVHNGLQNIKDLTLRLFEHLHKWVRNEQKGFIKGRYILDAIIGLWEGIEYAEESSQDYCFLKIDFDKAYDRLEWDFVVLALQCAGFAQKFIAQILTLFGNARARISINGALSPALNLKRSIRQGCPLAPLVYAIAIDGLSWLVEDRIRKHRIEVIKLPHSTKQMCLQLFADDTNALVANKEASLKEFWNCRQIFCVWPLARRSIIVK